jgi:uncharacterized membrane protein (UPF0127 family)
MRRYRSLIEARNPLVLRMLAAFVSALCLSIGITGSALALPTDREPLLIETRSGPVKFAVELALTPADRATGLMHRQSLPADHGMLFRFDRTRQIMMWMKNTPLSLDMVFIGEDGVVAGIARNTTPYSEAVIPSPGPVRYVLELNAGTALRHGISAGDRVRHRIVGKDNQ